MQKWDDINSKKPKNLGKETPGKSPSSCQKPPKALLCSPLQWKKKISHYDSFHFCHRVPQADQRTELLVVYTFTYLTKSPGGHRQAGSPSSDQNAHRTIFFLVGMCLQSTWNDSLRGGQVWLKFTLSSENELKFLPWRRRKSSYHFLPYTVGMPMRGTRNAFQNYWCNPHDSEVSGNFLEASPKIFPTQ